MGGIAAACAVLPAWISKNRFNFYSLISVVWQFLTRPERIPRPLHTPAGRAAKPAYGRVHPACRGKCVTKCGKIALCHALGRKPGIAIILPVRTQCAPCGMDTVRAWPVPPFVAHVLQAMPVGICRRSHRASGQWPRGPNRKVVIFETQNHHRYGPRAGRCRCALPRPCLARD